jgi:hypothetical protein
MTNHDNDDLLIPTTPEGATNFTLGLLDAVACLYTDLIGYGVVVPNAFQQKLGERASLARANGNTSRALALELLIERLTRYIEPAAREAEASIVKNPDTISRSMN